MCNKVFKNIHRSFYKRLNSNLYMEFGHFTCFNLDGNIQSKCFRQKIEYILYYLLNCCTQEIKDIDDHVGRKIVSRESILR
jgi:hypothetical protein